MSSAQSDAFVVVCSCGAKLKVTTAMVGKRVRCPRCKDVLEVTAPRGVGAPAGSVGAGAEDGTDSLLNDLAAMERSAPAVAGGGGATRACPHCGVHMPLEARLCVACGYDQQSGRVRKMASARKAAIAEAVRGVAKGGGGFLLGCGLSAAGAMIAAVVWCAVAVAVHLEIGYIAWGLGLLAGIGMSLGYRRYNIRAGVMATVIAALGIVAAKVMIFAFVNRADLSEVSREISAIDGQAFKKRMRLIEHRTKREAVLRGLASTDEERDAIVEHFTDVVDDMTARALESEIAALDAWEKGKRWEDEPYVRAALIHDAAERAWEGRPAAGGEGEATDVEPTPDEWGPLYAAAEAEIDGLSPDARRERVQALQARIGRKEKAERLAERYHRPRGGMKRIPPWDDEANGAVYRDELRKYSRLSDEELDRALAEMQRWDAEGRWTDADYVRMRLIYYEVELDLERRYDARLADGAIPGEVPPPGNDEWPAMYAAAEAKVDALSPQSRVDKAKGLDADRARRLDERAAAVRRAMSENAAKVAVTFIMKNYFDAYDLLFSGLALITAYRVGCGREGPGAAE
ncbi:MAG: hypothetical protein HY763_17420 [Planctomycetes bacterium]|nr:hypothetical protein [Planctomycetota bacterium]